MDPDLTRDVGDGRGPSRFRGPDLVEPGVTLVHQWRPEDEDAAVEDEHVQMSGGVAIKTGKGPMPCHWRGSLENCRDGAVCATGPTVARGSGYAPRRGVGAAPCAGCLSRPHRRAGHSLGG
ncbi:hypothetical protein E1287_14765 [Actinomadura sp. KC06]|nr:hypothetical protein E1287_14765 [Actinomadura sp. KC06]